MTFETDSEGLSGSSSAYVEELGISLGDRALSNIQQLVDNKKKSAAD